MMCIVNYSNLLYAAGATLLLMNFTMYNGNALTATMTATFQAKRVETTKERSDDGAVSVKDATGGKTSAHQNIPAETPC
jgi:hypothetical protein